MTPTAGNDLESGYFKIHILVFTIAFDLYIFLPDRNSFLLLFCFVDRSLQIEKQAFSSHLQNVEGGSAGREFKIKANVSTGFKDLHIVVNDDGDGCVFHEYNAIDLFV